MNLSWKDEYDFGIKIIDDQHKKFLKTLDALMAAIGKNEVGEKQAEIFSGIDNYSKFHFATEEKYFDEFSYAGAEEHKQQHREFIEKIEEIKKQFSKNEFALSFELADYLEGWLIDHVLNTDKKYVECFREHGLGGK